MKTTIMILVVSMALFSCTSAKISSNLASGAIGCRPDEITILNETATFVGSMHNFEAICRGKRFICSYQPTTGINCKEALESKNETYDVLENGVIKDTELGLEWKMASNSDITWNQAKAWAQNLKLDGGGWRMPTEDELERFYHKGVKPRNITVLIIFDGYPFWTTETKGSDGRFIYFADPTSGDWYTRDGSSSMRAIAVRSRKN